MDQQRRFLRRVGDMRIVQNRQKAYDPNGLGRRSAECRTSASPPNFGKSMVDPYICPQARFTLVLSL